MKGTLKMKKLSEKIKENNLFVSEDFTYEQYVNQLIQLQALICQEVFKEKYNEKFRVTDVIYQLRRDMIEGIIPENDLYYIGNNALKQIDKELSITFSGKKAESHVDELLKKHVSRDDFTNYTGVYLNNGLESTEIDNLILTKDGFLILEVKNIKTDVKISEEGRLFVNNECSYEQIPLAEKMKRKRNLFKTEIKKALKRKGVHMDIVLNSLIVFNEPKDENFYINNQSNERWCKSNKLVERVNKLNYKFPYSDEQLNILRECCEEFETHKKTFVLNYDIENTINDICVLIDSLNSSGEEPIKVDSMKQEENVKNKEKLFIPLQWGLQKLNPRLCLMELTVLTTSIISSRITKY